jgi:hypothetical protein
VHTAAGSRAPDVLLQAGVAMRHVFMSCCTHVLICCIYPGRL